MIKDGWIYCPMCHGKTKTKVTPETTMFNFPLFCHRCKRTTMIDIVGGEMGKVDKNES